jgi:hypothetical protein
MQLELQSGNTSALLTEASPGAGIDYRHKVFAGTFLIQTLSAQSNSSFDGPTVDSEVEVQSFTVKNLTRSPQTLTLRLSDVGFDPNSPERPLTVSNSASVTFSKGTGALTLQTFAFDGTRPLLLMARVTSRRPVLAQSRPVRSASPHRGGHDDGPLQPDEFPVLAHGHLVAIPQHSHRDTRSH